jgi:hypothetical protein
MLARKWTLRGDVAMGKENPKEGAPSESAGQVWNGEHSEGEVKLRRG